MARTCVRPAQLVHTFVHGNREQRSVPFITPAGRHHLASFALAGRAARQSRGPAERQQWYAQHSCFAENGVTPRRNEEAPTRMTPINPEGNVESSA
jgi:hypothetical protein